MGRKGLSRRAATVKIGALVAVLVLALIVPTVAFAANTASFSLFRPIRGTASANVSPMLSVVVLDRFGVKGSANYALYLDGVKQSTSIARYSGFGLRKFKLSRQTAGLADGVHTVKAWVKDTQARVSSYTWTFRVDTTAPNTVASNGLPVYPGAWFVQLSATDAGSGVAHTFFILDGGLTVDGTLAASMFSIGSHTLEFWSVDNVGNVESHHMISGTVIPVHSLPTSSLTSSCLAVGCHHAPDIATIHIQPGGPGCVACHGTLGIAATNNCLACHSGDNAPAGHAVHVAITSAAVGGKDCTASTCHGSSVMGIHGTCAACHNSTGVLIPKPTVDAAIAAGVAGTPATCETCHGAYAAIHAAGNVPHAISGSCFAALCHNSSDASLLHTTGDDPPGCVACHAPGTTPSTNCIACHPNLVTIHSFVHADATGTKSSACTTCHGTDIPTVHAAVGCVCHTVSFLRAEMGPLLAAGHAECVDCHKGTHAAHGFDQGTASGHNTTTYGTIGAKSKFDGSQGPLLTWESEETTVISGKASGNNGSYTLGQTGTVTSKWDLPTANVFWGSTDPSAPPTAMKGLTWASVITCQDCHTNLSASLGPQGANAGDPGLDANYPGDYAYAELSKYTQTNNAWPTTSTPYLTPLTVSGIAMFPGALTHAAITTASVNATPTGALNGLANRTDGTTGPTAVICAKCHDLENFSAASGVVEGSNTAHDSHHQDQRDGSAQCVNCHIGIPHGWIRPRLLVDTDTDVAPFLSPDHIGTTRTGSTGNNTGNTINPLTGFNGQGMQALSGVNDHPIVPITGLLPYVTGSGLPTSGVNLGHVGTVLWDESECQACGDHVGENAPAKIVP